MSKFRGSGMMPELMSGVGTSGMPSLIWLYQPKTLTCGTQEPLSVAG